MAQRKKSEITPQSNNSFVVQGSSTTHLERDIKANKHKWQPTITKQSKFSALDQGPANTFWRDLKK